jgi:hypothetical protein
LKKVGENIRVKIKTTQLMKSTVPDNIKIKSCFIVNLFENFILKIFQK